jgi:hypothetical protein
MGEQFDHWLRLREEKNKIVDQLHDLLDTVPRSPDEAETEADFVDRYNRLYQLMDEMEFYFTDEDRIAYEQDQAEIREAQRQAWLIQNRYGSASPTSGIADWWTTPRPDLSQD